jgi:hypothetical protein
LTFLVALVMAGVVTAMKGYKTDQGKNLGDAVVGKIKDAVDRVQFDARPTRPLHRIDTSSQHAVNGLAVPAP